MQPGFGKTQNAQVSNVVIGQSCSLNSLHLNVLSAALYWKLVRASEFYGLRQPSSTDPRLVETERRRDDWSSNAGGG